MTLPAAPKNIILRLPPGASDGERAGFERLCRTLAAVGSDLVRLGDRERVFAAAGLGDLYAQPTLSAASHVIVDLVEQGWSIVIRDGEHSIAAPGQVSDPNLEKQRIRRQEHLRRDPQLRTPSVRKFVERLERPREHRGKLVSIFSLMRDGRELATALAEETGPSPAIKPYVQIVNDGVCGHTGLKLHDIWRYFRHTWSNAYFTVPGRSMPVIVRDAATPHHAVIGIAAISSPVVQIAERDQWIGWDSDSFLSAMESETTAAHARWICDRISTQIDEIFIDDLLRDSIIDPRDISRPTLESVQRLRAESERQRSKHYQSSRKDARGSHEMSPRERAQTPLFRSKRASVLADTLAARMKLAPYLVGADPVTGLRSALGDAAARTEIKRVIRKARGERVGTVIADLTVCGAVAPYNALAGGKLVGAMAVSPRVIAAYKERYDRPSHIASSIAGRPIIRESRLSFISTTSLYGSGSSQYNRLRWPASLMGGDPNEQIAFAELGRSRSFGTSHFSDDTVDALVRLSLMQGGTVRVNSIFGEGVSPRLRKVRLGFAALGWPAAELLKHGRERILYGVQLVSNLRDYSLGFDAEPQYLVDPRGTDESAISRWWLDRWGRRRFSQPHVLASLQAQTLARPIRHGARVLLPAIPSGDVETSQ
jgi:hypothetical protein